MIVCGCEISAQEIRLAVCQLNDDGAPIMKPLKQTRIEIKDDTDDQQLRDCQEEIRAFTAEHQIDRFVVKSRARKGRMAGGPATFKLETLIQLNKRTETQFVHAATLSSFAKKNDIEFPERLPVYLKNAFLVGAYGLTN